MNNTEEVLIFVSLVKWYHSLPDETLMDVFAKTL